MKKNRLFTKSLVIGILALFIGASIIPSVIGIDDVHERQISTLKTIIVDDEGDGDYSTIAEAVTDADPGDTIEVYSGTYSQNLVIGKQLKLWGISEEYGSGDDTGKPVIDAGGSGTVISISAEGVEVTGFVIQNSGSSNSGIYVRDIGNTLLSDNTIQDTNNGIYLKYSSNNVVDNNVITGIASNGIYLKGSEGNAISGNIGIMAIGSSNNEFNENRVLNNPTGMRVETSSNNIIYGNHLEGNTDYGIYVWDEAKNNLIYFNNFLSNGEHAYDPFTRLNNKWNGDYLDENENILGGNYWDDYNGVDTKRGVNQDESGSDGIGDTPYNVPSESHDIYPRMYMFDDEPPVIEITKPLAKHLYVNNNQVIRLLFLTIVIRTINVTVNASDDISGVNRVVFFVGDEEMANSSSPPYYWLWQGGPFFRQILKIVTYDNAGNSNSTDLRLWKIF